MQPLTLGPERKVQLLHGSGTAENAALRGGYLEAALFAGIPGCIAQALQQDLAAVGITAELRTQAQSTVIAAGGEPEGAPMIWSGGMAWIADYPDPSNFYWPILSCAAATPGGWNWAWYCNKELDAQAAAADAMVRPDQTEARAAAWADIYTSLMDDAPWVPVFNETRYTVHSARLAGPEGAFVDPTHTPVDYENVYLR